MSGGRADDRFGKCARRDGSTTLTLLLSHLPLIYASFSASQTPSFGIIVRQRSQTSHLCTKCYCLTRLGAWQLVIALRLGACTPVWKIERRPDARSGGSTCQDRSSPQSSLPSSSLLAPVSPSGSSCQARQVTRGHAPPLPGSASHATVLGSMGMDAGAHRRSGPHMRGVRWCYTVRAPAHSGLHDVAWRWWTRAGGELRKRRELLGTVAQVSVKGLRFWSKDGGQASIVHSGAKGQMYRERRVHRLLLRMGWRGSTERPGLCTRAPCKRSQHLGHI